MNEENKKVRKIGTLIGVSAISYTAGSAYIMNIKLSGSEDREIYNERIDEIDKILNSDEITASGLDRVCIDLQRGINTFESDKLGSQVCRDATEYKPDSIKAHKEYKEHLVAARNANVDLRNESIPYGEIAGNAAAIALFLAIGTVAFAHALETMSKRTYKQQPQN